MMIIAKFICEVCLLILAVNTYLCMCFPVINKNEDLNKDDLILRFNPIKQPYIREKENEFISKQMVLFRPLQKPIRRNGRLKNIFKSIERIVSTNSILSRSLKSYKSELLMNEIQRKKEIDLLTDKRMQEFCEKYGRKITFIKICSRYRFPEVKMRPRSDVLFKNLDVTFQMLKSNLQNQYNKYVTAEQTFQIEVVRMKRLFTKTLRMINMKFRAKERSNLYKLGKLVRYNIQHYTQHMMKRMKYLNNKHEMIQRQNLRRQFKMLKSIIMKNEKLFQSIESNIKVLSFWRYISQIFQLVCDLIKKIFETFCIAVNNIKMVLKSQLNHTNGYVGRKPFVRSSPIIWKSEYLTNEEVQKIHRRKRETVPILNTSKTLQHSHEPTDSTKNQSNSVTPGSNKIVDRRRISKRKNNGKRNLRLKLYNKITRRINNNAMDTNTQSQIEKTDQRGRVWPTMSDLKMLEEIEILTKKLLTNDNYVHSRFNKKQDEDSLSSNINGKTKFMAASDFNLENDQQNEPGNLKFQKQNTQNDMLKNIEMLTKKFLAADDEVRSHFKKKRKDLKFPKKSTVNRVQMRRKKRDVIDHVELDDFDHNFVGNVHIPWSNSEILYTHNDHPVFDGVDYTGNEIGHIPGYPDIDPLTLGELSVYNTGTRGYHPEIVDGLIDIDQELADTGVALHHPGDAMLKILVMEKSRLQRTLKNIKSKKGFGDDVKMAIQQGERKLAGIDQKIKDLYKERQADAKAREARAEKDMREQFERRTQNKLHILKSKIQALDDTIKQKRKLKKVHKDIENKINEHMKKEEINRLKEEKASYDRAVQAMKSQREAVLKNRIDSLKARAKEFDQAIKTSSKSNNVPNSKQRMINEFKKAKHMVSYDHDDYLDLDDPGYKLAHDLMHQKKIQDSVVNKYMDDGDEFYVR